MVLKFKKGFSLVELLVVIAIIGILAAVGITAYQGYTTGAKEKATAAQHAQVVAIINAEMAKCVSGSGDYAWTGGCDATPSASTIANYLNATMGLKNPYKTDTGAAEAAGTASAEGKTAIECGGTRADRNMECIEWENYVDEQIPYEATCPTKNIPCIA